MAEWNGVPENPERGGWHWLHHPDDLRPIAAPWIAEIQAWSSGAAHSPQGVVDLGFRYLGPCHTPAEAAALVEAAGVEMRERASKEARSLVIPEDCSAVEAHGRMIASVDAAHRIDALPLPTPSLGAIRAQARREGMEAAASIARAVEDKPGIRTAGDAEAAIRAAMDKEAGK